MSNDELSSNGDTKHGNFILLQLIFGQKTFLFRTQTTCYAKSKYSLIERHDSSPSHSQSSVSTKLGDTISIKSLGSMNDVRNAKLTKSRTSASLKEFWTDTHSTDSTNTNESGAHSRKFCKKISISSPKVCLHTHGSKSV